ncbi:Glucans biosynthesis protein C [Paenibacillus solanacearum]|uniref:Glucans biosynthesis protein C n=1 Tax=Paenibacillus solanacearum TaxID=2048548 RepID=A0A916K950_9BACL|nr:acyltransferase family protein [Paenibacillus solanacearum]CAG7651708.1 Glucans biosynthesis protein C [Paenibacillus solanacearum]
MRKDYIDWLRNIGILYLFIYHTARVFDDLNPFYIKGETNAFSSLVIHSSFWFMPLLFLLAGMSSFYALQSRTAAHFVKERFLRLLVPLVVGTLIIVPPQGYYARKFHLHEEESYLVFLKRYFTDISDWSEYAGGISPAHLWFILFLFLISVGLLPLMIRIIRKRYSPSWMRHPLLVILPFAGLSVLSSLPDVSGKNIFLYAGYFILGYFIATSDTIIDLIEQRRRLYLMATLIGTALLFWEIYTIGSQSGFAFTVLHLLLYWVTLLTMLGYGKKYLNRKSAFMNYFNPAAFPVYILHQTYLIIIGYYVLKGVNHGFIPFLLIAFISFGMSIATYEIIRRIKLLRVFFGLKA